MSGNKQAAQTLRERYGEDYFSRLGRKGAANHKTKFGFQDRELAKRASKKGLDSRWRKPDGQKDDYGASI